MTVAEYEKRYTKLAKYAMAIIADEMDRGKRFEEDLRKEICTPVTVSVESTNFSKLVEAAMKVEKSLSEEKTEKETFRGGKPGHPSRVSCEQTSRDEPRRFVLSVSGRGNFKARSSGPSFSKSKGGMPRQGQRRFGQMTDTARSSQVEEPSESAASLARKPLCGECCKYH